MMMIIIIIIIIIIILIIAYLCRYKALLVVIFSPFTS